MGNWTNKFNIPDYIANQVMYEPRKKVKGRFSASKFSEPIQAAILKDRYSDQIVNEVRDSQFSFDGKLRHGILEYPETNVIKEFKLEMPFKASDGSENTLVCIPDRVELREKILADLKIKSIWGYIYGGYDDEIIQLSVNKYIFEWITNMDIEKTVIDCIFRDWKEQDSHKKDYPKAWAKRIELQPLSANDTYPLIDNFIVAYNEAQKLYEPDSLKVDTMHPDERLAIKYPCNDRQKWAKPDTWAVRRKGHKKALRVFNTEQEAIKFSDSQPIVIGKPCFVEIRKGDKNVRCHKYCISEFCQQYKKEVGNEK